jgi:hypothetical protein
MRRRGAAHCCKSFSRCTAETVSISPASLMQYRSHRFRSARCDGGTSSRSARRVRCRPTTIVGSRAVAVSVSCSRRAARSCRCRSKRQGTRRISHWPDPANNNRSALPDIRTLAVQAKEPVPRSEGLGHESARLARQACNDRADPGDRCAAVRALADHVLAPLGGVMPMEWTTEWEPLEPTNARSNSAD